MVVRHTEADAGREQAVAELVAKSFDATCVYNGKFDPVDFSIIRDGNVIAQFEVKSRTNSSTKYKTVYLSVRKYRALQAVPETMGAYFVVNFTDKVLYIDVDDVDASNIIYAGRKDRTNAPNDMEDMLEVPIDQMCEL